MSNIFIAGYLHLAVLAACFFLAIRFRQGIGGFAATTWIIWAPIAYAFFGTTGGFKAVYVLNLLGPAITPIVVIAAAFQAIFISIPTLLLAGVVTYFVFKRIDTAGFSTVSAATGHFVFLVSAWVIAEIALSLVIRTGAEMKADGHYCLSRASALSMVYSSVEYFRTPHATLVDGDETFTWSFDQMSFVPQTNRNFVNQNGEASCTR